MPRYAPIPIVSIDPRTEAQLSQEAAQVVYEASNRTLNDFSAGNPLAVLLEGQAFAQNELLFWANQLPEKILSVWIGPFLGAMRRLGTPAVAQLTLSVEPGNTSISIPAGTIFTTDPQRTGGQSIEFVSYNDVVIPAGQSVGLVSVYSKYTGVNNNVPAGSITGSSSLGRVALSTYNSEPATGGSNVELYSEVQERFFTLIRRRNPVSQTDWQDFFTDLYGLGTITSVQPNRSSQDPYNYNLDYMAPNGQVSFFVLGPDGVELTQTQLKAGQNAINYSVPIENQGHLFPITLSQVQYNITLEVNPNGTYGTNFRQSSYLFRNLLSFVMNPGSVFPATVDPTVNDIDSAFYNQFGGNQIYIDPHIKTSAAYNTPYTLSRNSATYTQVYDFLASDALILQYDLVRVNNPNPTFYPALVDFTPYSTNKYDQTIYGNLSLKQIKPLTTGSYKLGDIVYYDGQLDLSEKGLHVVLENIPISDPYEALSAIESGKISAVKTYSAWVPGNTYSYTSGTTIDPDIIEYDYSSGEFIPAYPNSIPLNNRPGALAWLVSQDFTLQTASNDITGAQVDIKLGSPVESAVLTAGTSYTAGSWVHTLQVGSGPDVVVDPNFYYVDTLKGAVTKYAYVVTNFTYNANGQTVSSYFDSLVSQGILIEVYVYESDGGLPIYRYKARFKGGQYLEYRETSSGTPNYYLSAQYFTPDSTDAQKLLNDGSIIELAPTPELKAQIQSELKASFSGTITSLIISYSGDGYVDGSYANVPLVGGDGSGATANFVVSNGSIIYTSIVNGGQLYRVMDTMTVDEADLGGSGSGLTLIVGNINSPDENPLYTPVRMFTFFKGDRTFFRDRDQVRSYTATTSVSPLFNFEVYYNNGIFIDTDFSASLDEAYEGSIPYFNPAYLEFSEDTIMAEDGKNFYRVMRAFTPISTVTDWIGEDQNNTARYEEYAGNLLRYVIEYTSDQGILAQFGEDTSAIKLGNCQITIIPKSTNTVNNQENLVYVWENTQSITQIPYLSWYTGTPFPYNPPSYSGGTLAL